MKKSVFDIILCVIIGVLCVGCGEKSVTYELTESTSTTIPEESTVEESVGETVESTPEATIEEIETTADIESEPELTEEPVSEPQAEYTYTDTSATMYATQTVNVRNLPCTDGEKVGSLSTNQEVAVTGQCNETSWYMFDYNGETAFVSNKYLSSEEVEVAPPAQEATQVENVPRAGDYQEGVWHNMGDYSFYLGDWTWPSGCQGGGFHLNDGSARFCWLNYSDAQNSALNAFIRANQCNCGEVTHGGIKPLWDEATKSYYFP